MNGMLGSYVQEETVGTPRFGDAVVECGRGDCGARRGTGVDRRLFRPPDRFQARFHATFGMWMTGLCVVRPEDGTWPSFGYLVKAWFRSVFAIVESDIATDGEDGMPAVVRRSGESCDTLYSGVTLPPTPRNSRSDFA